MGNANSRGLLANSYGMDTRVLAVCDVDTNRRTDAKQKVEQRLRKQRLQGLQ